jgi:hypothetical protein
MTTRALVIVIEDYSQGKFLPNLPGVNKDGQIFIQWLLEKKGVTPADILCCAGRGFKGRTNGTSSSEIINEITKAVTNWADKTDEFYFYFSGHGFSYSTSTFEKSVDILVASDFTDLATGGRACLQLNEIKTKLWKALGPRHHYYFIDACRNQIQPDAISPAGTGLGFVSSQLGTPTVYKMFSTALGAVSKTQSGFTTLLIKGLNGAGRAKGLRSGRMYIIFDLLCQYMKSNLQPSGQDVDFDREGSGDGYLLELRPIPQSKCEINVAKATPTDNFTLTISDIKGLEKILKFKGGAHNLSLFPDDYFFELKHATGLVRQKTPPDTEPLDLYDPCVVRFELVPRAGSDSKASTARQKEVRNIGLAGSKVLETSKGPLAVKPRRTPTIGSLGGRIPRRKIGGKPSEPGLVRKVSPTPRTATLNLKFTGTQHTELEVISLKTGEVFRSKSRVRKELSPGKYVVKLRERGITVSRQEVIVKPGQMKTINLLSRPKDKVRTAILDLIKADEQHGAAVFSESSLGPLASQDLGLWLSLFGASRILGRKGQFQKLERLPIKKFEDVEKDGAVVYVLAGFEQSEGRFGIGLSSGPDVKWESLEQVRGLPQIYEKRFATSSGPYLLSLKIPKRLPITVAVHCLPNRATLVTFTQDIEGRTSLHQSILPLGHLTQYLDPTVRSYLSGNMLGLVRTMTLAQSQFARKRSIQTQLMNTDRRVWTELMNHKWLDPIMALTAAYDVLRHEGVKKAKKSLIIVESNLRKYYPSIVDVEAISKLMGTNWSMPQSPPLFLDGILAFDEIQKKQMLPLSPNFLDYSSSWTAWRGAVNDVELTPVVHRLRSKVESNPSQKKPKKVAKAPKLKATKK